MEEANTALDLLIKTIVDGHREDSVIANSASWVIPIELKWEIEKFLEKVDE